MDILTAAIGASIANVIVNPINSINTNTDQCCNKIYNQLSNELSNTCESISKLVTACTNEVDVVKRLQILTIYGAHKLPNGDIEYKENDTRIVYNIATDEFKIYNNDSLTKSISKDGTVLLHKNEWTYDEKTNKLMKDGNVVCFKRSNDSGVFIYKIDCDIICGDCLILLGMAGDIYDRARFQMINSFELISKYLTLFDLYSNSVPTIFKQISKLSEEKKKKWNKKKPFWWFNKKKYFEELKKFRSELNFTRKIYNKLPKYNERKAEINSILEYFNKI